MGKVAVVDASGDILPDGSKIEIEETYTLTVRCEDRLDMEQPRGKQSWKPEPFACWYTPVSGIWQSVWLEGVGTVYPVDFRLTPCIDNGSLKVEIELNELPQNGSLRLTASFQGQTVARQETAVLDRHVSTALHLNSTQNREGVQLWSPEHPSLYDLTIETLADGQVIDRVETYFGMRQIEIAGDQILLNHDALYQRLVLDQGYWADGLLTAPEIEDLDARLDLLARAFSENVDLPRLLSLFDGPAPEAQASEAPFERRCRIAVARDEAFRFAYAETLETFEALGAELVFFSPLRGTALPEGVGGLYLPGGYPELHARQLSENANMRRAVAEAVRGGLPTAAECGGFLYLCTALSSPSGERFPMAGVLPGEAADAGKSVRFGYAELTAEADSLLFRAGERFPVHEFHHWDAAENGDAFRLTKPLSGRTWREGYAGRTLYAAFPHLYFAGSPVLAERFVCAAEEYGAKYGIM